MNFYRTTRLMLSSAAFLSLAGSAFALDGADLLKKLNAAYAAQGGTISADILQRRGRAVDIDAVSRN
ncbi:hypothetical protein AB9F46_36265, partial [Rhizobium leguminosarum]